MSNYPIGTDTLAEAPWNQVEGLSTRPLPTTNGPIQFVCIACGYKCPADQAKDHECPPVELYAQL